MKKMINLKKNNKCKCPVCGKEVRINEYNVPQTIITQYFKVEITRDMYFCRKCGIGFSPIDQMWYLFDRHKVTRGMVEEIAYSAQNCLSFEKGAENIKRYRNVEVSESMVRTVSERIGQIIYEKDIERAKITYAKPEESVPSVLEKDKKKGILYNYADGS